jgi:hypothetical protein
MGLINLETLKLCEQINEENIRKAAEKLSNSTYVSTEPSRGKSQGRELTRNATTANLKKSDNKGLLRDPSTKALKSNKSKLNITADENGSNVKDLKGQGMKRNITVANFNKTPLKHQPKTSASDKKDDSKYEINIELKRTPTTGKLNTTNVSKDGKSSKITLI